MVVDPAACGRPSREVPAVRPRAAILTSTPIQGCRGRARTWLGADACEAPTAHYLGDLGAADRHARGRTAPRSSTMARRLLADEGTLGDRHAMAAMPHGRTGRGSSCARLRDRPRTKPLAGAVMDFGVMGRRPATLRTSALSMKGCRRRLRPAGGARVRSRGGWPSRRAASAAAADGRRAARLADGIRPRRGPGRQRRRPDRRLAGFFGPGQATSDSKKTGPRSRSRAAPPTSDSICEDAASPRVVMRSL